MILIDASDGYRVAAEIESLPLRYQPRLIGATRTYGGLLLTHIIRNASTGHHAPGEQHIPGTGPGPNWATSDYRRSWSLQVDVTPKSATATAGTNDVRAPRLERGFIGTDRSGAMVHAPPYPHAQPALEKIGPLYDAAVAAILTEVIG